MRREQKRGKKNYDYDKSINQTSGNLLSIITLARFTHFLQPSSTIPSLLTTTKSLFISLASGLIASSISQSQLFSSANFPMRVFNRPLFDTGLSKSHRQSFILFSARNWPINRTAGTVSSTLRYVPCILARSLKQPSLPFNTTAPLIAASIVIKTLYPSIAILCPPASSIEIQRCFRDCNCSSEHALRITAILCRSVSENLSPTSLSELLSEYPLVNKGEKSAAAALKSGSLADAKSFPSDGCGPLCVRLSGIINLPYQTSFYNNSISQNLQAPPKTN